MDKLFNVLIRSACVWLTILVPLAVHPTLAQDDTVASHQKGFSTESGFAAASFTLNTAISNVLTDAGFGSAVWGDYDNDGDLDILLTGRDNDAVTFSEVYDNDGAGGFTRNDAISDVLRGVSSSEVAWADYDNDGDLDILLTGQDSSYNSVSEIYDNDGVGDFTKNITNSGVLTGVNSGAATWGDYDNDGDLDLLLTGAIDLSTRVGEVYDNDGEGGLTKNDALSSVFADVVIGSVEWGDYDNDGDLDLLLTGQGSESEVYDNDGIDGFTSNTTISGVLTDVSSSSAAWGDYDNDGDLDILLTGRDSLGEPVSEVYDNDGAGGFTRNGTISGVLTGVRSGNAIWGDYDNDGDLDILLMGLNQNGSQRMTEVFDNNGAGGFAKNDAISSVLRNVSSGSVAWGDYDNDGDLDLLVTGHRNASDFVSEVYTNSGGSSPNAPPAAPTNLATSDITATEATLTWNAPSDDTTPAAGLGYRLRIGTSPGGFDVQAPMSIVNTTTGAGKSSLACVPVCEEGLRKVVAFGEVRSAGGSGATWQAEGLNPGQTYYWSVQAIDHAFAGSAFATEGSFTTSIIIVEATKTDALFADGDSDGQADPGDTLEYTVTLTNPGMASASDVAFADDLDANTALVSGSVMITAGTGTVDAGPNDVNVTFGSVPANGTAEVTFRVTVHGPFPAGVSEVCNQGLITGFSIVDEPTDDADTSADDDLTCTSIDAAPEVSATKTDALFADGDSDGQADPGDTIRYTVSVMNTGSQDAAAVIFEDLVDANTTLDCTTNPPTTTQGTVTTCDETTGMLAIDVGTVMGDDGTTGGGTETIQFDVVVVDFFAAGVDQVCNQGTTTSGNFADMLTDDPDDATGTGDPTCTLIDATPDLLISKDDDGITAQPDDGILYTLTFENQGTQDATGVEIIDTVPVGTIFDADGSTAGWSCSDGDPAGTVCTFVIGDLSPLDGEEVILFTVEVDSPIAAGIDQIENTATIADDGMNGDDPTPANNTATDTTPVDAQPDLAIMKDDGNLMVQPGDTISYSLTYTNNGNQGATGVEITDIMPTGTTFNATTSTAGWSCSDGNPAGTVCTFSVSGEVAGGGAGAVTFAATVDNPVGAGIEEIENTAMVSDDGMNGDDPTPANNTATDTTPVDAAAVVMATKTDALVIDNDGDGRADPGDTIEYTVTVTNTGDQDVAGVIVSDTVDPNTELECPVNPGPGTQVSCTPGAGGSFVVDITTVDGEPRIIAPKASESITFRVVVVTPFPAGMGTVENQATAQYTGEDGLTKTMLSDDPSTSRPMDPTATEIDLSADLFLTKSASPTTPDYLSTVTFTLMLENLGPVNGASAEVSDELPKGLVFVSASGEGTYNETTGRWDVAGIDVGSPVSIDIIARVETTQPVTNTATIIKTRLRDENPSNNTASTTITPVSTDLGIEKRLTSYSEDASVVTATFTLTASNDGPSTATGVVVTDLLDDEATIVSVQFSDGSDSYNAATGAWTIGTLAAGGEATMTMTITADARDFVLNYAEIAGTEPDPNARNNASAVIIGREIPDPSRFRADVSLTKTVDNASPTAGSEVVYTLTATNGGPFTTAGVEVTDLLPSGVTFVSATTSDATDSYDAQAGLWLIGALPDGAVTQLQITARVTGAGEITNTAEVTANHLPDPDSITGNGNADEDDQASATLTVNAASEKDTAASDEGETEAAGVPVEYALHSNYPNPFNPQTTIPYGVPESGQVRVAVYDLLGREVAVLLDGVVAAGRYEVVWEAGTRPTGMYLVRMEAAGRVFTRRVTLMK